MTTTPQYKKQDFTSDKEVRWCPGCGDYAILSTVQKVMSERQTKKEKYAVISGIGCSSRFPIYMNTFGFHTIHGRGPTVATGVKIANPELDVWLISGDGDGLSIGGNHLLHILRRNVNVNILLFNNRIYGLTKGQYSPTSEIGKVAKSTPYGSIDDPVNPIRFALASNASFIARTYDTNPKHMAEIFHSAADHKGVSFIEIFQNCIIFNDDTFGEVTHPKARHNHIINLKHNQPLIFGKEQEKCLIQNGFSVEIKNVDEVTKDKILIHNETAPISYGNILSELNFPNFPTPMGIIRKEERMTYDEAINEQVNQVIEQKGKGDLDSLLSGPSSWTIK